jgi:hypothetical protein
MTGGKRRSLKRRLMVAMTAISALLAGSVAGVGCLGAVANNFNPCGTILNCDPNEYDLMMNSFPDWDLDPTCTIPGQCGDGVFPFDASGDTVDTTADTTTTTTGTGLFGF